MGVKKASADANYRYILVWRYLSCTIHEHVAVSVDLKFCFHIYLFLFIHGF